VLGQLETSNQGAFPIREYLTVLRVRKWSIISIALVSLLISLAYTYTQTPMYTSSAEVLVRPTSDCTFGPCFNMQTETVVALSPDVAAHAAKELGVSEDEIEGVSVANTPDTEVLVFSYSHSDPETAQQRAQAFAKGYLAYRSEQANAQVRQAAASLSDRIGQKRARLDELNAAIAAELDPVERTSLTQRAGTVRLGLQTLKQELVEVQSTATEDVGQVVQDAYLPAAPSSPQPLRTAALGLAVGLGLGVALALFRERLDDRLTGRGDLEAHAGVSVLAVVPHVVSWKKKPTPYLVTVAEPHSIPSEAYRTLRTGILFAGSQRELKTIMVTSANPEEGKTATSANLGVALAQAGKNVVLVSADLRKPRLQDFFGLPGGAGLTNVLAGESSISSVLEPVSAGMGHLRLLPSGPIPGNPAELLGSEEMGHLMASLRDSADFIILDVPPILPVADAMTLARHCDAVLFVADATSTTRGAVETARRQLDQVNARLIGAVLNNFEQSQARVYSAHHEGYYAYRQQVPIKTETKVPSRPWAKRKT
jgi:tyrosine-protein kinase